MSAALLERTSIRLLDCEASDSRFEETAPAKMKAGFGKLSQHDTILNAQKRIDFVVYTSQELYDVTRTVSCHSRITSTTFDARICSLKEYNLLEY